MVTSGALSIVTLTSAPTATSGPVTLTAVSNSNSAAYTVTQEQQATPTVAISLEVILAFLILAAWLKAEHCVSALLCQSRDGDCATLTIFRKITCC